MIGNERGPDRVTLSDEKCECARSVDRKAYMAEVCVLARYALVDRRYGFDALGLPGLTYGKIMDARSLTEFRQLIAELDPVRVPASGNDARVPMGQVRHVYAVC